MLKPKDSPGILSEMIQIQVKIFLSLSIIISKQLLTFYGTMLHDVLFYLYMNRLLSSMQLLLIKKRLSTAYESYFCYSIFLLKKMKIFVK